MMRSIILFVRIAPLLFILSGCGLIDYFYLPVPEDTAQELWEAGSEAMREKDYYEAAEYFSKLIDRYPFSPYTVKAELGMGDAYFLNEDYVEAVDAYMEFESLHPRHAEIPYVLYQIGVAGFNSFTTIDRPQHTVAEGLQYLYRLKEVYPESEYAKSADEYIVKCRDILAKRELFVADFYWRTEQYGGAWKRYQFVVENFPDLPEIHEYALRQSELAYLRYQEDKSQKIRDKEEGTWTDYFEWL